MAAGVTLEQLIRIMIPSDRLIVENNEGKELYRGYVGCMEHIEFPIGCRVKRFGLSTNIFRKEKVRKGAMVYTELKEEVNADHISDFLFSDLAMEIFTRVVLEG